MYYKKVIEKQDELLLHLIGLLSVYGCKSLFAPNTIAARLKSELTELKKLLPVEQPMYEKDFVEWMWFGSHQIRQYFFNAENKYKDFYNDIDHTIYTLDELHTYWEINIKEK